MDGFNFILMLLEQRTCVQTPVQSTQSALGPRGNHDPHSEKRPVLSRLICIGCDDDDDEAN